jgi:zinc D-Ala-D-Ala carboxypeptidase
MWPAEGPQAGLATDLAQPRLLRADLVEDKVQGGVVGACCVVQSRALREILLQLRPMHESAASRDEIHALLRAGASAHDPATLSHTPEDFTCELCAELGVPASYAEQHSLQRIAEPLRLHYAGRDYVGRTLWLQHGAARAWPAMRRMAADAGVDLEAVSGFRSAAYQAGILRRKLERGMTIEQALAINTAPGYSEHHSGRAIDIGTPGSPAAEEIFETTPAFAWLRQHARQFGFRMSYPRDNPHGVVYEPWHWYYQPV